MGKKIVLVIGAFVGFSCAVTSCHLLKVFAHEGTSWHVLGRTSCMRAHVVPLVRKAMSAHQKEGERLAWLKKNQ